MVCNAELSVTDRKVEPHRCPGAGPRLYALEKEVEDLKVRVGALERGNMRTKEIEVLAGENVRRACEALARQAPAFMIFNGTRVDATLGDTAEVLFERWVEAREAPPPSGGSR